MPPDPTKSKAKKKKKNATKDQEQDDGTQVDSSGITASRKKKVAKPRKKQSNGGQAQEPTGKKLLAEFIANTCKTGIPGILAEFDEIKRITQPIAGTPKIAFDTNADKNRYKDVYCVDESRVVLKWPAGMHDYIHANWVTTADNRKYICTQGPTATTIDDFWRMVWQEKSKSIVMLCNVVECGKKKCEQYFPENPGMDMRAASLTIKCVAKEEYEKLITLSTITVSDGGETLEVRHYQWNNWPDRGVPVDTLTATKLISQLKTLSPTVIHCSAGIGRTGTIVGLDMCISKITKGDATTLKQIVMDLRKSRHGSVQMDIQYLYMHRVLVSMAVAKKAVTDSEVMDFIAAYEALCKQRGFL